MRDIAQDLFDRFAGFVRGHSSGNRGHPGVGAAFIIAALLVLLLGLRWFTDSGGASGSTEQDWALDVSSGGPTTTIGASPEAVAVRVGTAVPHGADEDATVTIGIPGTSIEIEIPLGPTTTTGSGGPSTSGSTGGGGTTTPPGTTPPPTRPGGGGTTTPPTTAPPTTEPPTTAPPTTEPPTTEPPTTEPPTTEPPTTVPEGLVVSAASSVGDLVGQLVDDLGALLP